MKKTLLLAVSFLAFTAIPAAADKTPEKGDFSTEVQFNPFDQDGNMFKLESLKFRYFLTDKDVLRFNVGFNIDRSKVELDDDKNGDEIIEKNGSFNVDLGYERHFHTRGRLDLYAGGQVGFQKDFVSGEAKDNGSIIKYINRNVAGDNRAKMGCNIAAFTGLDFYVYKGLYVGTELGFSFNVMKDCRMKIKEEYKESKSYDDNVYLHSKFYIEPCLRLGWTF